jgi:hypothetical protein
MKAAGLLWLLLFSPLTAAGAGERVNFVNRTGRPVHLQL